MILDNRAASQGRNCMAAHRQLVSELTRYLRASSRTSFFFLVLVPFLCWSYLAFPVELDWKQGAEKLASCLRKGCIPAWGKQEFIIKDVLNNDPLIKSKNGSRISWKLVSVLKQQDPSYRTSEIHLNYYKCCGSMITKLHTGRKLVI